MSRKISDTYFEEVLRDIKNLLENDQLDFIRNIIADLHPADISDLIEHLDSDDRKKIFTILPHETASEVLAELEDPPTEVLLEEMDTHDIAKIVDHMDSDDAADVLAELPIEKATEVLEKVEEESSVDIQELLTYREDSAGGIMAKEYAAINANFTIQQAIDELRKIKEKVGEFYNVYVVDDMGKLVGLISLKDIVLAEPNIHVRDVMNPEIISIESHTDQEEVAKVFQRYDLVSAPVINHRHKLIGRITIDDILDVINEETDEDLRRIAGTGEVDILEESIFRISRARIPWLILSFFGEIVSALVMNSFSATLDQVIAAAFFIPLVMAMGGNTGTQTSIIVVRGLATGEISIRDLRRRLWREIRVTLLVGLALASLIFGIVTFWQNNIRFAAVLAGTLVVVVINASIFGSMIPFILKKINIDPALATGPFISAFNDIVGLLIYFALLTVSLTLII
jgi:magnesium transporter